MRWGAAALLQGEKGFRRIQGYEHLGHLIAVLKENDAKLAPQRKAA